MNVSNNSIVGEVVATDYRTAAVFKQYGIDFCCRGNQSIEAACINNNIAPEKVINELKEIPARNNDPGLDFNSWPLDLLVDYIEKRHHRYVEEKSREILPYLQKVVNTHASQHPELIEVEKLFKMSVGEMAKHMKKEELILFPYIRKMVRSKQTEGFVQSAYSTVQNPISMMMHEHDSEGDRFKKIAMATNNYTPPEDACNTFRVTFAMLKEFEEDLFLHIHLENNILFPKSIILEKQLITA